MRWVRPQPPLRYVVLRRLCAVVVVCMCQWGCAHLTALHGYPQPRARAYQQEAVDFFFKNAKQAAEGHGLRFQMACGTGKTFTYALIIRRDMAEHPGGHHVIFVPWRDLARQTAAELERLGVKSCIIGDGCTELDWSAPVIVCVYASAYRLRGNTFRIKIVDEAHHLEMKGDAGFARDIMHGVSSELAAHFTATFYNTTGVHFRYDFDRAVDEGHVCDFLLTVPFGGPRKDVMGKWIVEKRKQLAPMLVVLNRVDRAKSCAKLLCDLGLSARALHSKMNYTVRSEVKDAVRTGQLEAACIVNMFNEGVSMNELKSVIFWDKRCSAVNVKQLSMRVTRLHETKPIAHVVLPLCEDLRYDREIRNIIRSLAAVNSNVKTGIRQQCAGWFNVVNLQRNQSSPWSAESDNISEQIFDRFGRYLAGPRVQDFSGSVDQLKDFVVLHGHLPRVAAKRAHKKDEAFLARFLKYVKRKLTSDELSQAQIFQLKLIPLMQERIEEWTKFAENHQNFDWKDRCRQLKDWEAKHHRLPKGRGTSPEEKYLMRWLVEVGRRFRKDELSKEQVNALMDIPGLQVMLDKWTRQLFSKKAQQLSWSQGCQELGAWMKTKRRMPRQTAQWEEHCLWHWLRLVRLRFVNNTLTTEEIQQLEEIPTMLKEMLWWEARWGPKERWLNHCEELKEWLETRDFPYEGPNASLNETRLAIWYKIAVQKLKKGTLSAEQTHALASIPQLEGIADYKPAGKTRFLELLWHRRFLELQVWQLTHKKLPTRTAGNPRERTLAYWLAKSKWLFATGHLSHQQIEQLREIPGVDLQHSCRVQLNAAGKRKDDPHRAVTCVRALKSTVFAGETV
ncbi:unnamed protein product [Durusdinium trenchii]|uniref:Helicase ATP-binding domain-containing protein n=1 Tax=Durusdinium trenchii TaxID=1381693 RepID=A0ABP0RIB7_9DINO